MTESDPQTFLTVNKDPHGQYDVVIKYHRSFLAHWLAWHKQGYVENEKALSHARNQVLFGYLRLRKAFYTLEREGFFFVKRSTMDRLLVSLEKWNRQ